MFNHNLMEDYLYCIYQMKNPMELYKAGEQYLAAMWVNVVRVFFVIVSLKCCIPRSSLICIPCLHNYVSQSDNTSGYYIFLWLNIGWVATGI